MEDEVHRSSRLRATYPWFDGQEFASERLAKQIRLAEEEKEAVRAAQSVLHGWVLSDPERYTSGGRSPPGTTDCWLLALGQVKPAIVVTDDLGMHALAQDFGIGIWHGFELLDKLRSATRPLRGGNTACAEAGGVVYGECAVKFRRKQRTVDAYEFPFDLLRSTEIALLHTYGDRDRIEALGPGHARRPE